MCVCLSAISSSIVDHTPDVVASHQTDEYIDDFNPEDLAKYKLEIDMEVRGFPVGEVGEGERGPHKNSPNRSLLTPQLYMHD